MRNRFRPTGARCLIVMVAAVGACNLVWPNRSSTVNPPLPVVEGEPRFRVERVPDSDLRAYNHTASAAVTADGTLHIVWGSGTAEAARDTAIYMNTRSAEGVWSHARVIADATGLADANCVLDLRTDGTLELFHSVAWGASLCESVLVRHLSHDNGTTWIDNGLLSATPCLLLKNKPITLRNGRRVLPAYVQGIYASFFFVSDDGGANWIATPPALTLPSNLQPAVSELSDGSLLTLARNGDKGSVWQGRSLNGGRDWTFTPRDDIANPDSGLDLLRHSSGVLIYAGNDSLNDRLMLVVRASIDEGVTWLPARTISASDDQQSYPTLVEGPDGVIHCVFSDDLEAIGHAEFNLAWLLESE